MLGSLGASAFWSGSHFPNVCCSRLSTTSTCAGQWSVREGHFAQPCRSIEANLEYSRFVYSEWRSPRVDVKDCKLIARHAGLGRQSETSSFSDCLRPDCSLTKPSQCSKRNKGIEWAGSLPSNANSSTVHNNLTKLPTLDLPQHLLLMHTHFHTNLIQAMFAIQKLDQLCSLLPRFFFFAFKLLL